VFDNPHEMWQGRKACPGYGNERLLTQYQAARKAEQADAHKEKRREAAARRRAERHHNGDQHVLMATVRK